MSEIKVTAHGELMSLRLGKNVMYCNQTQARQLIADIMAALDEPAKVDMTNDVKNDRPNIPTQAYQEFDKHPLQNAVDELWNEKEIPFTTEQKMQAVIRKAEITLLDTDEDQQIVEAPFKEIPIGTGEMGIREWYRHYQWLVKEGFIRR